MSIDAISAAGGAWQSATNQVSHRPQPPSLSDTASVLGISTSQLDSDLQSGTTLSQLASQSGVSSSDLLTAVEQDLQSGAPSGSPALSTDQLQQMATNLINGTRPTPPSGGSGPQGGGEGGGPPSLSLSNTAQLLGISTSQLSSDLQSGTTLSGLAEQSGVSSSSLLTAVEQDIQSDAPSGAPSLSSDQLQQMATNLISGTNPWGGGNSSSSGGSGVNVYA